MYTPLGEYVLLKLDQDDEQTTASGLVVARMTQDALSRGEVIAIGDGAISEHTGTRLPMEVSVGDRVVFHAYAGAEVTLGNEKHKLIRQSDLVAKEN